MSVALEGLGTVLEADGWVRYSDSPKHLPGIEHISWTNRLLPLRLWSTADRTGMRSHILACSAPKGAGWVWRVELAEADERLAAIVCGSASFCLGDGHCADVGQVFTGLTRLGWEMTCATDDDEPSYGAVGPDGASLVHLPDSPVDPGMWVITTPSGGQLTASSATPWPVVVVMAIMC